MNIFAEKSLFSPEVLEYNRIGKESVMNEKALKILEFDKITAMLVRCASSPLGQARCRDLAPSEDLSAIQSMQRQTADGLSRLFRKGSISFGGARDILPSLKRLAVGGTLNQAELLTIASLLENAARARAYGRRENSDQQPDSLDSLFEGLEPVAALSSEIRRCLPSEEEVSDDASPALRRLHPSAGGAYTGLKELTLSSSYLF